MCNCVALFCARLRIRLSLILAVWVTCVPEYECESLFLREHFCECVHECESECFSTSVYGVLCVCVSVREREAMCNWECM